MKWPFARTTILILLGDRLSELQGYLVLCEVSIVIYKTYARVYCGVFTCIRV